MRSFQTKDWHEARKKFETILQREPNDRNVQVQAQEKLAQVQEKLEREKWLSLALIALSWIVSSFVTVDVAGIGGFVSGTVIWWVSQRTKQAEPSQQVLQLLLFIFIGFVLGIILGRIINYLFPYSFSGWITAFTGGAIAVGVMFRQIRRQVF